MRNLTAREGPLQTRGVPSIERNTLGIASLAACAGLLAACTSAGARGTGTNGAANGGSSGSCTPPPYSAPDASGTPISPTAAIQYEVSVSPASIAVTPSTEPPDAGSRVYVQARTATAHPYTLWDSDDIAALTTAIANDGGGGNTQLIDNFFAQQALADKRLTLSSSGDPVPPTAAMLAALDAKYPTEARAILSIL